MTAVCATPAGSAEGPGSLGGESPRLTGSVAGA